MLTLSSVQIFPHDSIVLLGEGLHGQKKVFLKSKRGKILFTASRKPPKIHWPEENMKSNPRATRRRKCGFGAVDILLSDLEMQRLVYEFEEHC